ncbi:MAG: Uncharacterised protein [Porticoccaceae bacterium UBA1117]|nr:MAG: Uncharacterised protein [Porticoccaceae bacterium UBA1117]
MKLSNAQGPDLWRSLTTRISPRAICLMIPVCEACLLTQSMLVGGLNGSPLSKLLRSKATAKHVATFLRMMNSPILRITTTISSRESQRIKRPLQITLDLRLKKDWLLNKRLVLILINLASLDQQTLTLVCHLRRKITFGGKWLKTQRRKPKSVSVV